MTTKIIFDHETAIAFDGLWGGRAKIYEFPIRTVTFKRLSSDKAKVAALRLGYSPAVDLPHLRVNEDEIYLNEWVLEGELICPLLVIFNCCRYGSDFFKPNKGEIGHEGQELEQDV